MPTKKIKDSKLIEMVDAGKSQSEIGKAFGVSTAAVNKRLKQLRRKATHAVVNSHRIEGVVNDKLNAIEQLKDINQKAHSLLDTAEDDPSLAVKLMAEIRNQLKLQLEIFEVLYSVQGAAEFQESVLETLEQIDPELRKMVVHKLNQKSALRSALRFK